MEPQDSRAEQLPTLPVSSVELIREAMDEARQLIILEVALAKDEVKREAVATKSAAIALVVGAAVLLVGASLLLVALALAIFPGPIPSLVLGLLLIAAAAIAGVAGVKLLPKKPLGETRRRLETDFENVKERIT